MFITDLNNGDYFVFQTDVKSKELPIRDCQIYVYDKYKAKFTTITSPISGILFDADRFSKEKVFRVNATFEIAKEKPHYIFLDEDDIIQEGDESSYNGKNWSPITKPAVGQIVGIYPTNCAFRRKVKG